MHMDQGSALQKTSETHRIDPLQTGPTMEPWFIFFVSSLTLSFFSENWSVSQTTSICWHIVSRFVNRQKMDSELNAWLIHRQCVCFQKIKLSFELWCSPDVLTCARLEQQIWDSTLFDVEDMQLFCMLQPSDQFPGQSLQDKCWLEHFAIAMQTNMLKHFKKGQINIPVVVVKTQQSRLAQRQWLNVHQIRIRAKNPCRANQQVQALP